MSHARVHDLHPALGPDDAAEVFRTIGTGGWSEAIDHLGYLTGRRPEPADQIAAGRVVVDPRHVRVGSSAVHVGAARVTRGGEQVELDLPDVGSSLVAVPWLPYDERLLQRVVRAVGALLAERA